MRIVIEIEVTIRKKERATHRAQNKRYYKRFEANNENSKSRWSVHDIELVLKHEQPDSVLSKQIGRSVKAIQTIRGVYKDRDIEGLKEQPVDIKEERK